MTEPERERRDEDLNPRRHDDREHYEAGNHEQQSAREVEQRKRRGDGRTNTDVHEPREGAES